jgi:anti-sigma-K factor RskA
VSGVSQPTEIHTLSGAYALDALTEIERAAFARHLAECEACATEVAEFQETAARLSAASNEAPPPRLREAVLAEVGRTRQVTAGRAERPAQTEVARWRRRTAAAVAAGLIALAGMGTVWVVQERRVGQAEQQAASLAAVMAAGDTQLRTVAVPGGGTITVAVSKRLNDGFAVMSDLPAPPPGKAYQLWLIRGTEPTSAGVMNAGQTSGRAELTNVDGADLLGVTVEPAGGSARPSTPTVAGVSLV